MKTRKFPVHQFTSTDKKLITQDVAYWASAMDVYLQFYAETSIATHDDKAAKAIACARLQGLALAMIEHFGNGVHAMIDTSIKDSPDIEAAEATGTAAFEQAELHWNRLESLATQSIN